MNTNTLTSIQRDPGGRPPSVRAIRVSASRHARAAIATLAAIAQDEAAPSADRVSAAQTLLAHAVPKES
ncbi:hypothetical protein [Castellaniella sp.]|uniref:hypothetical protein n=1 Tax=Castellaniella sp. TaxID=1955812 RepID=UPI002AFE2B08|nr:hypothetical protein [Castellaniella sp.]